MQVLNVHIFNYLQYFSSNFNACMKTLHCGGYQYAVPKGFGYRALL